MGAFHITTIVVAICLAIYGIFSYLAVNAHLVQVEVDKELLKLYGDEMLPHIIEGITEQVSNRLMRYYILLESGGLTTENEFKEGIKKAGDAYNKELKGNQRRG